jgi:hypothetical protein
MGFFDGKRGRKLLEENWDVLKNGGFQNIITKNLSIFPVRFRRIYSISGF